MLSAGYGTRLGKLTAERPKPMLDVGGRPIVEWIVRHLAAQGIRELAVNLHFMPEEIQAHLGAGEQLGVEIVYSHERELLGTAGAAKKLEAFLSHDEEFMLHYGDVVTNQNFRAMLAFHRAHPGEATILTHERSRSNSVVEIDAAGRVERFLERPTPDERRGVESRHVFSGVCVCGRVVLDSIPADVPVDLPREVLPGLVERGALYAYALTGSRVAVDSEDRLSELRDAVADRRLSFE